MIDSKDTTWKDKENQSKTIQVHNAFHQVESDNVEIWVTYSFAPDWLNDAMQEAKKERGDYNALRREILFAVAFAESYIVEWMRDEVLKRDFQRFTEYFPLLRESGIRDKWKVIPEKLREDKLISGVLNTNKKYWQEWIRLVKYRNGLVHAGASWPERATSPVTEKPVPPLSKLAQLEPGWAVKITAQLVEELHKAAKVPVPNWLHPLLENIKSL